MNLSSTDDQGNVIPLPSTPAQRDIAYDDPYPFFRGMMPPEEVEPVEKALRPESPSRPMSESPQSGTVILANNGHCKNVPKMYVVRRCP